MGDLQGAMGALQGVDQLPEVIDGLKTQTARAAQIADALKADYEALLGRVSAMEEEMTEFRARLAAVEQGSPEHDG
jgi:phage shock protein A